MGFARNCVSLLYLLILKRPFAACHTCFIAVHWELMIVHLSLIVFLWGLHEFTRWFLFGVPET